MLYSQKNERVMPFTDTDIGLDALLYSKKNERVMVFSDTLI